jgi:hypothetical protein
LRENNAELIKLQRVSLNGMSERLHKLEHSLEAENHLLRMISLRLSAYQRAVEKSSALRSLAFQERVLSGDAENDQVHGPQAIVVCSQCGAEVKRNG